MTGWLRARREQVGELGVRVRLDLFLVGSSEGEERCGAQRVCTPLDPQGVDNVEEIRQRQITQP
ncbi:hypothetical protein [Streptosporangium roseum]|uniref:hypothetical protein n=1 Tax=Streptosporangium roseum TaxID=2001 RepID=UPI0012DCC03C|nr:hypothetical protein [Streptosporangium roseum]